MMVRAFNTYAGRCLSQSKPNPRTTQVTAAQVTVPVCKPAPAHAERVTTSQRVGVCKPKLTNTLKTKERAEARPGMVERDKVELNTQRP